LGNANGPATYSNGHSYTNDYNFQVTSGRVGLNYHF
jgi:hypothetical protein